MDDSETHRVHILLAEDNDDMRRLLALSLRRDGFVVIELVNGIELQTHLHNHCQVAQKGQPIDLIISDINMPGKSGLRVLEDLRSRGETTPVILITTFGDDSVHAEAARLKALVLDKPFDINRLRQLVQSILNEQPRRLKSNL